MEENLLIQCPSCSRSLPQKVVYFCGACLTQVRCRSCDSLLEKDYIGCTNCGIPKDKAEAVSVLNSNTFKLHETLTDRTIEASFSDAVGKDLAGILKDFSLNAKAKSIGESDISSHHQSALKRVEETIDADFSIKDENAFVDNNSLEKIKPQQNQVSDYPSLKAIAMKNLPSTEIEWIVVYSFYASNYGEDSFARHNILEKYEESKRLDHGKKSHLSRNIVATVKAGYINPLTQEFSILDEGIALAKEIISRTTGSPVKKISTKRNKASVHGDDEGIVKKSSNGKKTLKRLTNIDFEPTGKDSLKSYFSKYSPKSDYEKNLLFVDYLQNVLEIKEITYDHIYTCYDLLELRVSENLPQTVRNTSSDKGWIETKNGKVLVTIKGKNQIRDWQQK